MTLFSNRRLIALLLAIPALLLVPATAMLFTREVNWTAGDFLVMGGLLSLVVFAFEGVLRTFPKKKHRLALLAAVAFLFILIWAELAVGIFGSFLAGS